MASTKGAYQVSEPKYLLNALNYFHRNFAAPIDDTMVWNTLEDLQAYIDIAGSYAYAGQVVTVANGTTDSTNGSKDYSMYIIRSDKSLQPLSSTKTFTTVADAEAVKDELEVGTVIAVWNEDKERHELYTVENSTAGDGTHELQRQSFDVNDIPDITWENLQNKPTSTVSDIDAAVTLSKKFTATDTEVSYNSKQLAYFEDIPTTYDAAKLTGTIDIARLPASAVETIVVVADDTARLALTKTEVQNGDTVKVNSTGQMYFVKDDTVLGTEAAFEPYTATAASSVPWSGVTNKPTTVDGYGITDAVKTSDVVDDAKTTTVAGKIVKTNSEGKLVVDITGDAATLEGHAASYFATATDLDTLNTKVTTNTTNIGTLTTGLANTDKTVAAHTTALDTLNNTTIPAIQSGESITALAASKLTGIVSRDHLPTDVSGEGVQVLDETARKALLNTGDSAVHNGFIVKETSTGAVYVVVDETQLAEDAGYMQIVADGGSDVAWSRITSTPTTLSGYGITDALNSSEKVTTASVANAGKLLALNSAGKLDVDITGSAAKFGGQLPAYYATATDLTALGDRMTTAETDIVNLKSGEAITALAATKLTGTIPIERLPHGALERCVVVTDDTARLALTTATVQAGDTVKVASTGVMYFVVDDTNLNSEDGYEEYTAGSATSVPWSGVTGAPTALRGTNAYGFTDIDDVVFEDELVSTSIDATGHATTTNAGKVLKLNSAGKLDVQITGKVDWSQIENGPTSTVADIDAAVTAATHANRAVLDKISTVTSTTDSVVRPSYDGKEIAYLTDCSQAALDLIPLVDTEPTDAVAGQFCLVKIDGATS